MIPEKKRTTESDCPVCYASHDDEIHEATMRLRDWFHFQVTHHLQQEEMFASANDPVLEARVA